MKNFFLILFFLISSCGFKPIYTSNNEKLFFSNIEYNGEISLQKLLSETLLKNENNQDTNLNKLIIDTQKQITPTSKNSKGQITTYRTTIETNLLIINLQEERQSKKFLKNFTYNTKENKSELIKYQQEVESNLYNQIAQEIITFLKMNDY